MSGQGDVGGSVPVWDGAARSWRRYTREVAWYVQSTAPHKRRHCASRLMGKLSGPARLLAMSWSHAAFDSEDGTRKLLQRLASSPLVRKTLPNAAAICQQYFSFRRHVNESIGNFLVRETLVHEEFQEAIIRLHEEKMGITQESKDFGLPPVQEEDWSDETWGGSWESWWNYDEDYLDEGGDDDAQGGDDPPEGQPTTPTATGVGDSGTREPGGPTLPGATGSSPSHREDPGDERQADPSTSPSRRSAAKHRPPPMPQTVDELSMTDSFIMGVLRGWRLLQAAGLTAEEKRDILSTTRNSLDYEVIAQALQGLWDEQLLGHRYSSSPHSQAYYMGADEGEAFYHEYNDDWGTEDDNWSEGYAYYHDYEDNFDDPWWYGDTDYSYQATADDSEPIDDEKYKEAKQAEKVAESLALEAQRTWADAQKATQALRRDRGFGASGAKGHFSPGKCYACGGNHFIRDCPTKGKGKQRSYMADAEDYGMHYAVVKDLIAVILSHDKQAVIEVDQSSRPYFRFGDGRWGRQNHSFAIYALPNPAEFYKSNFDKTNLVPILIGMDFLGKQGHYMLDLCHYITRGHKRQVHVLELHPVQFDLTVSDVEFDQRELEQAMVATLRTSAPKAKAKPLDPSRAMKGDPRDPRADAKTWPCMGRHVPGPPGANNHGQWQHCARCDFRMSYIPRQGSKGQFTATKNPEMVARALRELRPLMGDFAPTATIVRAMQAKVDAEEVLRNHIRDLQASYAEPQGYPNQLETMKPTTSRTSASPATPSSTSSWQVTNQTEMNSVTMAGGYEAMDNQQQP
ncbi:unnamed protein product [Symbiodinium sp. CCMP2592]|nr:unnamed protein product [Symbiodinium sp. CCMP2592]